MVLGDIVKDEHQMLRHYTSTISTTLTDHPGAFRLHRDGLESDRLVSAVQTMVVIG